MVNFPTGSRFPGMTGVMEDDSGLSRTVLKRLLRPLVKLLIAKGVTLPTLHEVVKELGVEVVEESFRIDGKAPSDSRVSLLTGVHRKSVREIRRRRRAKAAQADRHVSVLATVVGRWLADPAYRSDHGAPLPLPRHGGEQPSFEALVTAVSADVRPRTVLDELLRRGVVGLDQQGSRVTLLSEALVPRETEAERLHFFARNLGDHIAAAVENVLSQAARAPFLERAVFYNRLRPHDVDALEAESRRLAGALLNELNRQGFAAQHAARGEEEAVERFRFGVYFYREDEDARTSDDGSAGDREEAGHG